MHDLAHYTITTAHSVLTARSLVTPHCSFNNTHTHTLQPQHYHEQDIVGTAGGILGRLLCDLLGSAPGGILAPSTAVIGLLNGLLIPTAGTPALPATGVLAAPAV
jgi:hypothetical protein